MANTSSLWAPLDLLYHFPEINYFTDTFSMKSIRLEFQE